MNTAPLEDFLRDTMGLATDSIGRGAVVRAARRSMEAAHLIEMDVYLERLRADQVLRQQLIEELVVPETWFFRDQQPFVLLAKLALERRQAGRVLRLLSLPCSTGEEPYSIAMALLEAGLSADEFRIDGVDISEAALAAARRASYGNNSFRGENADRREHWFQAKDGRWELVETVRAAVKFHQANLFEFAPAGRYDFVFCRNLLIYFDAETQSLAVKKLLEALTPPGVLFTGHAEAAVMLREGLASWPMPRSFAFTRTAVPAKKTFHSVATMKPRPVVPGKPTIVEPRPFAGVVPEAAAEITRDTGSLAEARELADRGKLDEAARLGHAHIEAKGPTAEAYYLIAITLDARGEVEEAVRAYRKVLYLDPKHTEAITHLALLLEKRGEAKEAERLWQRVRRPAAQGGNE